MNPELFVLGIKQLDDEHQVLVSLLRQLSNELEDASNPSGRRALVEKIIADMYVYTSVHFGHEETHMMKHKYAGLEHHQKLHREILSKLDAISAKIDEPSVAYHLNIMLTEWIFDHILRHDGAYAAYYHRNFV